MYRSAKRTACEKAKQTNEGQWYRTRNSIAKRTHKPKVLNTEKSRTADQQRQTYLLHTKKKSTANKQAKNKGNERIG